MTLDEVKALCDAPTYRNAEQIVGSNAITQMARSGNTLFAQVVGSSTYTVQIELHDSNPPKARCSCPAARRMPYCKHAIAVLIAWVQTPERFQESLFAETPQPAQAARGRARRETVERTDLQQQSVQHTLKIAIEQARGGLLSASHERIELLRALSQNLESLKARRLAQAVSELADLLEARLHRAEPQIEHRYAQRLANLWLTLRALQEHYADRRPLPLHQYEEMLGRTWREKDLEPRENLRLAELAYENLITPTGFRLDISHLMDLDSGTLYREMKIVPLNLRFGDPAQLEFKPARSQPLLAKRVGLYPGYAPQRLKILEEAPLGQSFADLFPQIRRHALTSAHEARMQLIAHASDPFAPPQHTALIAPAQLVWAEGRAWWADENGEMMPLALFTLPTLIAQQQALLAELPEGALIFNTASDPRPLDVALRQWRGQPLFGWLALMEGDVVFLPLSMISPEGVRLLRYGEAATL